MLYRICGILYIFYLARPLYLIAISQYCLRYILLTIQLETGLLQLSGKSNHNRKEEKLPMEWLSRAGSIRFLKRLCFAIQFYIKTTPFQWNQKITAPAPLFASITYKERIETDSGIRLCSQLVVRHEQYILQNSLYTQFRRLESGRGIEERREKKMWWRPSITPLKTIKENRYVKRLNRQRARQTARCHSFVTHTQITSFDLH